MAKKKRSITMNSYLQVFANETLSAIFGDSEEAKSIIAKLESEGIRYTVGDIPKMEHGKVVGCSKQITVLDGKKFKEKPQTK